MLFSLWCRPGSVLKQQEGDVRLVLNWDRCAKCILAWVENRMSQVIASFMRRLLWCIVLMITQILDSLYGTAQLVLFMLRDFVRIVTTLHCKCSINTEVVVACFWSCYSSGLCFAKTAQKLQPNLFTPFYQRVLAALQTFENTYHLSNSMPR